MLAISKYCESKWANCLKYVLPGQKAWCLNVTVSIRIQAKKILGEHLGFYNKEGYSSLHVWQGTIFHVTLTSTCGPANLCGKMLYCISKIFFLPLFFSKYVSCTFFPAWPYSVKKNLSTICGCSNISVHSVPSIYLYILYYLYTDVCVCVCR